MAPLPSSQPTASVRRPYIGKLRRWLLLLAVPYLVILVSLYANQEWLVFPGHLSQGPPPDHAPAGGRLLQLRTARGTPITALFGEALYRDGTPRADASRCPTVIHFYGTGTSIQTDTWEFEAFRKQGCNVIIPDYVGYGWSSGFPSEQGCYAAADAAYDWTAHSPECDPHKIAAVGTSLGGAVAIDLAARKPVAALATFSTFTSMSEMAQREYPWLPAALLLRHRFPSEGKLRRVHCPIFLAHGTADRLIPFSMRDRLARVAGGPVTLFSIPRADHNDFFNVGGEKLLDAFSHFLDPLRRDNSALTVER